MQLINTELTSSMSFHCSLIEVISSMSQDLAFEKKGYNPHIILKIS